MAAIIRCDDPPTVARQGLYPERVSPVHGVIRGKAVDQDDRLLAVIAARRNIDVGDARAACLKEMHEFSRIWRRGQ